MKLYSWNVNGIRSVMRKEVFLPFLAAENPDIVCLQEVKAQPEDVELALDGYHVFWNPGQRKGYSGTAVLTKAKPLEVRQDLPSALIEKYGIANDPYGNPNTEGRVLTVEFEKYFIVTVYTPNAKEDLSRIPLRQQWDPAFLEFCRDLEKKKPVIFCGDLNVAHTELDLANPGPNRGKKGFTDEERSGFQAFLEAGFVDTFRLFHQGNGFYTWWSNFGKARERNVGWRIDYILTSPALKPLVTAANIHPQVFGSDHCPVSLTYTLPE